MRAALLRELGRPPEPGETDQPDGAAVDVTAAALNPLDVAVGSGRFYGGHPELPYVPGCEAVGRRGDGSLVYLFGDGRGTAQNGFLAERTTVPPELPLDLPDGTDPALALAAGIAGVAGWVPVAWRAKVGPGDRVLVLGARGAVGQLALQAAWLLGAETVLWLARPNRSGAV